LERPSVIHHLGRSDDFNLRDWLRASLVPINPGPEFGLAVQLIALTNRSLTRKGGEDS
jgi:hypothetical protein